MTASSIAGIIRMPTSGIGGAEGPVGSTNFLFCRALAVPETKDPALGEAGEHALQGEGVGRRSESFSPSPGGQFSTSPDSRRDALRPLEFQSWLLDAVRRPTVQSGRLDNSD